jgi:glycosyltransferase involved in cell wall biosynthesis
VDVVHNGVQAPAEYPDPAAARRALGLSPEAVVAGLYSQLVPHKGGLDFVRAAHRAAPGSPNLHFVIAGSGPGPFMARLRSACDQGPAADRIRLLPPQPGIWDLLAATDVAVLTTLWPDPLPRVVMEAMVAGLPVVAYDGGGVPEMVADGETGLIVPTGDALGLGQALASLARSGEDRKRLGSAGRRRALRDFTVARHVERMERVVNAAVSGHCGPLGSSNLGP